MSAPLCGILVGLGLACAASPAFAAGDPSTRPASTVDWDGHLFAYDKPAKLIVEESTPTDAQVNWMSRPEPLKAGAADPVARGHVKAAEMGPLDVVRLTFRDADGEIVPALLCKPHDAKGPLPVVVAVHGLTSNKAQVCAQIGPALSKRGFAILALDLPRHGERPGNPFGILDSSHPDASFALGRRMVNDVRQLIDVAESRDDLDTRGGVTLVGYSMGSWVSAVAGPVDPRVKAMVLMVGGALEIPATSLLLPKVAATDPRLAIAHFTGRPLLMLNGRTDAIVRPDWARRLFAAAPEPKNQVWYDCGHFLLPQAYEDAAKWVAEHAAATDQQNAQRKAG